MSDIRSLLARTRSLRLTAAELSGLACIVYGVGQVSVPAAWIIGGAFATLEAVLPAFVKKTP